MRPAVLAALNALLDRFERDTKTTIYEFQRRWLRALLDSTDTTKVGAMREPTSYEIAILAGLQNQSHVYAGTADPARVARRRAANRAARRARVTHRRRAR